MRAIPVFTILAGSVVTPLIAADKSQASKANVEQLLNSQYPPTKLGRSKVAQPGSILVVGRSGIGASPATGVTYSNNYKDGQIKPGMMGALMQNVARDLQVGERVYLLKTEVKEASIVFQVQSCGACDRYEIDPNHAPYKASLAFQFPKRYLETAPFGEIQQTISLVFTQSIPGDPAANPAVQQDVRQPAQTLAVPGAQQPQEAPQAAPMRIELGYTTDQVVACMGQPDKVVKLGAKEIYVYKDLKITFLNGKVSDVE